MWNNLFSEKVNIFRAKQMQLKNNFEFVGTQCNRNCSIIQTLEFLFPSKISFWYNTLLYCFCGIFFPLRSYTSKEKKRHFKPTGRHICLILEWFNIAAAGSTVHLLMSLPNFNHSD